MRSARPERLHHDGRLRGLLLFFLTPLEPSCIMVYGPGKYEFSDFFKVGAPLTVLIYAIAILLVPWVWPL